MNRNALSPNKVEPVEMKSAWERFQRNLADLSNEFRLMAVTAEEAAKVLKRIAAPPVVAGCLERALNNLETIVQPTCDLCCHYQAHPPRCQLSKHSISPKQFSCKKYSPKHNPRK